MRRLSVVICTTVAIIAAGGYSVMWFKKADEFKAAFVASAASVNDHAKAEWKTDDFIKYQSVDVAGFPLTMRLTVHKPVVRVPASLLAQELSNKTPLPKATPTPATTFFSDWVEEVSYENISLESNPIGSAVTFTADGSHTQRTFLKGKQHNTLTSESGEPLVCHLTTSPAGILAMQKVFENIQSFSNSFRSIDCGVKNLTVKDDKNAVLLSAGKIYFAFTHSLDGIQRKASLQVNTSDTHYTAALDAVILGYLNSATNKIPNLPSSLDVFSDLGKTDVDIDISYNGPKDFEMLGMKGANAKFDVKSFEVHTNFGDDTIKGTYTLQSSGDQYKIGFNALVKTLMTEAYGKSIAKRIQRALGTLPPGSPAATAIKDVPPSLLNLHNLGTVTLDIDIDVDGSLSGEGQEKLPTQNNLHIRKLNITSDHNGILLNGETVQPKDGFLHSTYDATCINCDEMLAAYGEAYVAFSKLKAPTEKRNSYVPPISKAYFDAARSFLHSISLNGTDPGSKDLKFSIVQKDPSDIAISGKPLTEVMKIYTTTFSSFIPKPPESSQKETTSPLPSSEDALKNVPPREPQVTTPPTPQP